MKGIICHYTNAEGLMGIVANQCFWASKSTFTNDPSEIRFANNLVEEIAQKTVTPFGFRDSLFGEIDAIMTFDDIYILSFSRNPDVLSMWNRYAKGGGYSICLQASMFRKQIAIGYPDIFLGEYEVIYDRESQEHSLKKEIAFLQDEYEKANFLTGSTPTQNVRDSVLRMLFLPKHDSYRDEHEVRYIFTIPNQFGSNSGVFEKWTQFRMRSTLITPFIEIKFEPRKTIRNVYLSPGKEDRRLEGVDLFLRKYLGGVGVIASSLPYLEL